MDDVILSNWGKVEEPFVCYYGLISAAAIGEWFNNYGSSYYPSNIFETGASWANAILLYNMNSYGLEQQGFYIYFDKEPKL